MARTHRHSPARVHSRASVEKRSFACSLGVCVNRATSAAETIKWRTPAINLPWKPHYLPFILVGTPFSHRAAPTLVHCITRKRAVGRQQMPAPPDQTTGLLCATSVRRSEAMLPGNYNNIVKYMPNTHVNCCTCRVDPRDDGRWFRRWPPSAARTKPLTDRRRRRRTRRCGCACGRDECARV